MKHIVHYVPHTHFDAEVFLTREQTIDLGYSIALGAFAAMREDPVFKFVLDQTCYLEPLFRHFPEERSFAEKAIAEGRLEITCGMYAMPDVNIPSGESFIRQAMKGKRWCERELGLDVRSGWLLDTFGQHPQIPQLMSKCGFDYNVFQRIGTIDGPTEYWWKGLDGSRLFCHWMRSTYCILYPLPGNVHELGKFLETRLGPLRQHATTPHLLAVSGADLSHVQPHATRLFREWNAQSDDLELRVSTPREYFEAIRGADFPELEGDLNPVFQGCYSARIAVKQWNRKLEGALLDTEWLDAFASTLDRSSCQTEIEDAWDGVLFNQFHDIICGSHVDQVYANVIDRYKASSDRMSTIREAALDAILERIDTSGDGVPVVVFNPLSWERDDVAECSVAYSRKDVFEVEVQDSQGNVVASDLTSCERYENGAIKKASLLFVARGVPSMGYEVYRIVPRVSEPAQGALASNQPDIFMNEIHTDVMENQSVRLEIDAWNGAIRSIYHKPAGAEWVDPERPYAGTIVRELDNGNFWEYNGHCKGDALLPMNRDHPLLAEGDARAAFSHHYGGDGRVRNGSARTEYNVSFAFGKGFFTTRVRVYEGLPRVDIRTTLVNQDERVRYRMAIPTTLLDGTVTQEIPFGAIERPRGEFPAQNWMDYGDGSIGLAILNRGLPGNNVHDGVMMLSLLKCTALKEGYGEGGGYNRSMKSTDGYEIGVTHAFDYAILPHEGDWRDADLVRRGAEFNRPLLVRKARASSGSLPARYSFVQVEGCGDVSSVRSEGDRVSIRLYETNGLGGESRICFGSAIASASETNLIGQGAEPALVERDGRSVQCVLGPFEIKTFEVRFAASSAGGGEQ